MGMRNVYKYPSKSTIDKAVKYRLFYNKNHTEVLGEIREKGEQW